jgi:hypothetical protein
MQLPERLDLVDFLLANEHGILPIEANASERVTAVDGRSVETVHGGTSGCGQSYGVIFFA